MNRPVRRHVAALFALAVLVAVPYAQTLDDEWHFDDLGELNPGVRELAPRVPPHHYRGIAVLWTWAVDFRLHGEDPTGYHVTNIAIHLANVLLLYRLAWLLMAGMRARGPAAFAAAAVFAVHPLATQSVTYLTQRSTGLAALFLLLSWTFWIAFRRSGKTGAYVAALLALAVGLHTKPVVLLVPVLIAVTTWVLPGEESGSDAGRRVVGRRRVLLLAVPFLLLAGWRAVQLAPRMGPERPAPAAPAPRPVLPRYTRAEYSLAQTVVIPRYLGMMVLPAGQNLDPEVTPPRSAADPRVIGFGVLAAGIAAAVWRFRHSPPVVLGGVLLVGALVPTSSIVPAADLMAEHRAYVPLAGFCLALGAGFGGLAARSSRLAIALLSVVLIGLSAATGRRNAVWDTELSLWTDVAAKSPGKERPHLNLGLALLRAGRPEEAEREVRRALEIRPDYAFARNNLGNLLRRRGRADEAKEQYLSAIRARPGYAEPHVNLGNLAADRGDWAAA
ncbi:MAG TPA: tetratricopeptide repeat protein, partial [bacterium]|nr:tetratricopeptide repeat protein [bacterium]